MKQSKNIFLKKQHFKKVNKNQTLEEEETKKVKKERVLIPFPLVKIMLFVLESSI